MTLAANRRTGGWDRVAVRDRRRTGGAALRVEPLVLQRLVVARAQGLADERHLHPRDRRVALLDLLGLSPAVDDDRCPEGVNEVRQRLILEERQPGLLPVLELQLGEVPRGPLLLLGVEATRGISRLLPGRVTKGGAAQSARWWLPDLVGTTDSRYGG